jgi:hypothetical protein
MSDETSAERPARIWLQSPADCDPETGPMWCQDKVWPNEHDEHEPTEYVRADIYDAAIARAEAAEADAARLMGAHAELTAWSESEITRLRRLWTYMQEAAADSDADEPMTAADWLSEFDSVEQQVRAALAATAAKEPQP